MNNEVPMVTTTPFQNISMCSSDPVNTLGPFQPVESSIACYPVSAQKILVLLFSKSKNFTRNYTEIETNLNNVMVLPRNFVEVWIYSLILTQPCYLTNINEQIKHA